MSGKKEKQRRREQGISIDAKRGEADFARLVVQHRANLDHQARQKRTSGRKGRAMAALAVVAALAGAGLAAVL